MASVELEVPATFMEEGSTMQLSATAKDAEGNMLAGREITFASSDESVATVSGSGLVTGRAPGSVRITATSGDESASAEIAVREAGPLPSELSGTIRRVRFEIEEGATHTVTSDLIVFADELIDVRGELIPEPGASISLISDAELRISGVVGDTMGLGDSEATEGELQSTLPAAANQAGGVDLISGNQIFITGIKAHTDDVAIAGLAPDPELFISGAIFISGAGMSEAGGSVRIGSAAANQIANQMGKAATTFALVEVSHGQGRRTLARIRAGHGGFGEIKQSFDQTVSDLAIVHTDSPGGRGGDLEIVADVIRMIGDPLISAGGGGNGGSVSKPGAPLDALKAPDGALPGDKGTSIDVGTGPGGDGGDLILSGTVEGSFRGGPGQAGPGGRARVIAGNGAPSGDGGDATVVFGLWGEPGSGPVPPVGTASPTVVLLAGGNGGVGAGPGIRGGDGGTFTVAPSDPSSESGLVLEPSPLGFGNGGAGFSACDPVGEGSGGGAGGTLSATADVALIHPLPIFISGGDGGDGIPPGPGGTAGAGTVEGDPVTGISGSDGNECPFAVTVEPLDIFFDHTAADPCPNEIEIVYIMNVGTEEFTFRIEDGENADPLDTSVRDGSLQPDESEEVTIFFNCEIEEDFIGFLDFMFEADGEPPQNRTVTVEGTIDLPPNEPPIFNDGDGEISTSTSADQPVDITLPFSDPNGDQMAFTLGDPPANGTVTEPDPATGPGSGATSSVTYTPNDGFIGTDMFTVLADDGRGGVTEGKVTVTVSETSHSFRAEYDNLPGVVADGTSNDLPVREISTGSAVGHLPMVARGDMVKEPNPDRLAVQGGTNHGPAYRLRESLLGPGSDMKILQIAVCFSRLDGGALIRLLAEDLSALAEHAVAAGDTGCRNVEVPDQTAVIAVDFDNPGVHIIQEPTFDGSANSTTGGR